MLRYEASGRSGLLLARLDHEAAQAQAASQLDPGGEQGTLGPAARGPGSVAAQVSHPASPSARREPVATSSAPS